MKKTIEFHLKAWFKVTAIMWVLFIVYAQTMGMHDELTLKIARSGGTLITWYLWFYLIPRLIIRMPRKIFRATKMTFFRAIVSADARYELG